MNLVNAGIPTVFFTDANNGCYHTVNDDPKYLDWGKLKLQTHIAFRTALTLTETSSPPAFAGPNPATASFSDLVQVADAVHRAQADLALFSPADQTLMADIDTTLQNMVAAGPGNFGPAQVGSLLANAINVVNAFRRVPCQKF